MFRIDYKQGSQYVSQSERDEHISKLYQKIRDSGLSDSTAVQVVTQFKRNLGLAKG